MLKAAAALALGLAAAGGAAAEGLPGPRLTPEAFEAETTGRLFLYEREGLPFGAERYFEGRRVLWQSVTGRCVEGAWFPIGEAICFEYDDRPGEVQCWDVWREDGALAARLVGDEGPPLRSVGSFEGRELSCEPPGVGS